MLKGSQKYDFIVVGGGVYGLSVAYYLSKTKSKIALVDRFKIGHDNGSSHGPSRITRSAYEYDLFRDLNRMGLEKHWPEMQKVLNSKFIYQNDFIFFDNIKESYQSYEKVAKKSNGQLIFSTPQQICKKYPHFPFLKSNYAPIIDTQAGMIAADEYITRLAKYLKDQSNVTVFENTLVTNVKNNEKEVSLQTKNGETLKANKVAMACGRWIGELFPEIKKLTNPQKQVIAYLELEDMEKYQFGKMPSFGFNRTEIEYYCTPDRKGLGVKLGLLLNNAITPTQQQMKQAFTSVAHEWFGTKLKTIKFAQCHYTWTKTSEFIVDWIDPGQDRVLVCSCCSGHGFKFGPIMGNVIADVLVQNKSIELFQKYRHTFQIPYHQGVNLN